MDPEPQAIFWPPGHLGQWYTYDEVAELLRVSVSCVYTRCRRGQYPSPIRQGASSRFSVAQVATMCQGASPVGTHQRTPSVRSKGGKKGGRKAAKNRKARDAKLADLDQKGGA